MNATNSAQSIQRNLLALLLRPIVRFALQRHFSIQIFQEVLRNVFIQVAEQDLASCGEKANLSRVSVITGLTRREIARSKKESDLDTSSKTQPLFARVVAQWEQNPRYRDKKGAPKALSFEGEDSQFAELVGSISHHIKPATVLFELERNGAIERENQKLHLKRATIDATQDHVKAFSIVSRDIDALVKAVTHNLEHRTGEPDVHIRTEYDNIYVDSVPLIRTWLVEEARAFHKRARDFISSHDKDVFPTASSSPAGARVSVTLFSRAALAGEKQDGTSE